MSRILSFIDKPIHFEYKSEFVFMVFLLAFLLLPSPVFADDDDDNTETIGEIIVKADAYEEEDTIPDKPTSFGVVIPLVNKRNQYTELKDILTSETGIHTREFSGPGHLATVNIRGVSAKGVLVLIDGVPLNGLWATGVDLSGLPLNGFEKIEVYKGGGGAFYGDAALGGTINLVTGKSQKKKNNATFSIGSFNLFEAKTLTNHDLTDGNLMVSFQAESSLGDFPFLNDNGTTLDSSDDFNDTRENNETDSLGCLIKFSKEISEDSRFSIVNEIYQSRKGVPGLITFPSPNARQVDRRVFFQAMMEKDGFTPNTDAAFRFFFRRDGLDYEDKLGEATGSPIDTHRWDDLLGASAEFERYDTSGNGLWTGSFEFSHEVFRQTGKLSLPRSKSALSINREKYLRDGKYTLNAASRLDIIGDFSPKASFRLGGAYNQSDQTEWRVNFGNSFRVPGFDELYDNRGFVVGNPNLIPEKGFDFDFGFIHETNHINLSATIFHNRLRNQIIYELTSGHRFKPFNVGRSDMTGLEISFKRKFGDFMFLGNYTWLDARNRSDDPASKGKKLPARPEHELFAQVSSSFDPVTIECDYHYASGNFVTFANTTKLKNRSRFDVRLKWINDNWSITGEIRNLFDNDLTDVRGFPLPGRAYYLTFSQDF